MTLGTCLATTGALWIAAGSGLCQPPQPAPRRAPTAYYEDTNNIPVSPEVHPDRTVTCGREDKTVSFNSIQSFSDMLTEKKVQHIFNPSGGGHSWPDWQVYLSKYAPLLFRN